MRPRWQRTTRRDVYTVDVTAFLSLMVILVPFLLITAVFSRTTIIELQQAVGEDTQQAAPDPLQLLVTVRQSVIEVSYRGQAQPVKIDRSREGSALQSLSALATDLKTQYPQSKEATLLLEPQIPYEQLVQVLDVLRAKPEEPEESVEREVLFPNIALGPTAVQADPGGP